MYHQNIFMDVAICFFDRQNNFLVGAGIDMGMAFALNFDSYIFSASYISPDTDAVLKQGMLHGHLLVPVCLKCFKWENHHISMAWCKKDITPVR